MPIDESVSTVVSIVTWRAPKLTIDCLAALAEEVTASPDTRVIVVDNASGDGTAEAIDNAIAARGWGGWVCLVRSPANGGFGAGNNVALRLARARYPGFRYALLLNPDTAARPNAIAELRRFLDTHPDVGIAGGRCEDVDATPQQCCFRFPGIIGEFAAQLRLGIVDRIFRHKTIRMGDFEAPIAVGWVAGALMMVRREVFDAIGLMDEGYFLYYEETDLSLRAMRAGWSTWHVPSSRVIHFVGQLTGITGENFQPTRMPGYWFDSRRRYFVLNHGLFYAVCVDAAVVIAYVLLKVRRVIERKKDPDPPYWLSDLVSKGVISRGARGIAERQIQ
jgi:N-acetylglucosaminyl-diphospho-decaprenol L-rhamnosyltransferase